uniref:Uncharacterized protein n=1 Tax=Strongyloides venezuelensis TaxID=75913 RepID=A0A0K0EWZ7_STRVS
MKLIKLFQIFYFWAIFVNHFLLISSSFHIKAKLSEIDKHNFYKSSHKYDNKFLIDTSTFVNQNFQQYLNKENRKRGIVIWRLYNKCSQGFLQSFLKLVNAKGEMDDKCYSEFEINVVNFGIIALKHRLTKRYVCFNKRKRLTVKNEGHDSKCHFRELVTKSGYIRLKSVYHKHTFLGFNRNGRFLDPQKYNIDVHCFYYTKLQRYIPKEEVLTDHPCTTKKQSLKEEIEQELWKIEKENIQKYMYNMQRESILNQIRAT